MATRLHKSFGHGLAVASVMFLSALSFLSFASALNLGTLLKQESVAASPGDSVSFELLLWSVDKQQFNVSFDSSAEKGWVVMFNPSQAVLPVAKSEQYVGNVPAAVVNVFVSVPEDARPGNHTVNVTAYAGGEGYPIHLRSGRSFVLNINVAGQETQNKRNVMLQPADTTETPQDTKANEGVPLIFIPISVFAVLTVSYLIYRHR